MFKYISEILSKISQGQRITALVILVLAGVSIVLVPQYFDKKDCSELYKEVEKQGTQILQLNRKIVDNDLKYTDEKLQREAEIREVILKLNAELQKIKRQALYLEKESIIQNENVFLKTEDSSVSRMIIIPPKPKQHKHIDFSNVEKELKCLKNMVEEDKN
jgi:hypothetical protein